MECHVAMIVFACVSANHLGLIQAIEDTIGKKLPIVNCVKCFTFWCVLPYWLFVSRDVICSFAFAFFASYVAIWLELFMGFTDSIYLRLYETIYSEPKNDTASADTECSDSESTVPEL